ncbi:unnamed protein product [Fraxinus pennsylvanica]|uniref:Dienelactone hydrolase domain-containing protein n=1 Tax=Fraxinus pennsylvanica TaxID=56036 RepID=A0AAD2DWM4_9LAMI|nr:unnamed protein product [Fraxinus pennsylvanica]
MATKIETVLRVSVRNEDTVFPSRWETFGCAPEARHVVPPSECTEARCVRAPACVPLCTRTEARRASVRVHEGTLLSCLHATHSCRCLNSSLSVCTEAPACLRAGAVPTCTKARYHSVPPSACTEAQSDEEDEDEYDHLDNKITDTSAAEARRGKDIQGIPWERLSISREKYRQTRLEQYKNYENMPQSGEGSEKECKPTRKDGVFYEFWQNTRSVKSTILHFQVGVTCYCMRGVLAIASSVLVPGVDAVISFYGVPSQELADPLHAKAPVQTHFGELDNFVGFSDVKVWSGDSCDTCILLLKTPLF